MRNANCTSKVLKSQGKVLNWRAKSTGRLPVIGGKVAEGGGCHGTA